MNPGEPYRRHPLQPQQRHEQQGAGAPAPTPWQRWARQARGARTLRVVIEEELVRMRTQGDGIDLALTLVGDPGVDQVLGEDITLEQELVVGLERIEHLG